MEPSSSTTSASGAVANGGGGTAPPGSNNNNINNINNNKAEKESATLLAQSVTATKKKPIRFHVRPQVSISQWQLNGSWMGAILNFGSNYYVTAIRALFRREVDEEDSNDDVNKESGNNNNNINNNNNNNNNQRMIGLAVEAFGYRDLRAAHLTKVYRCNNKTGTVTQLQLMDYHYVVSTATYKSCLLFFKEDDFLPKCSYSFRYNGGADYESTEFLKNLTSLDALFAETPGDPVDFSTLKMTTLQPSDVVKDWNLEVPERTLGDRKLGKWGNPNGPTAPYSPLLMY